MPGLRNGQRAVDADMLQIHSRASHSPRPRRKGNAMTDLRESVARAIWDKDFRPMPAWDEMTWPEKLGYQKMATAALRALADAGPDDAMVEAAARELASRNGQNPDVMMGDVYRGAFPLWRNYADDARATLAAAFKTMGR